MRWARRAGPSLDGGILQWVRSEGNLRRPQDSPPERGRGGQEALTAAGEDSDSAPCFETALPDTKKVGPCHVSTRLCVPTAERRVGRPGACMQSLAKAQGGAAPRLLPVAYL